MNDKTLFAATKTPVTSNRSWTWSTVQCFSQCLNHRVLVASVTPAIHIYCPQCLFICGYFLNSVGPQDLMRFCDVPCNQTLLCGHKCSGTCGLCFQGRFHKACQKACEKLHMCGHRCELLLFINHAIKCVERSYSNSFGLVIFCYKQILLVCYMYTRTCPK